MTVLQCQRFPYLKLNVKKADGGRERRGFQAGKMVIEDEDPLREQLVAAAARNPYITIHEDVLTCVDCAETFVGAGARGRHSMHRINVHDDRGIVGPQTEAKVTQARVKEAASFVCDVCSPPQTFVDEAALAAHTADLHAVRPVLDGNDEAIEVGAGPRVRQGTVTTGVPAATRKKSKG
jgi:hypothetical protein